MIKTLILLSTALIPAMASAQLAFHHHKAPDISVCVQINKMDELLKAEELTITQFKLICKERTEGTLLQLDKNNLECRFLGSGGQIKKSEAELLVKMRDEYERAHGIEQEGPSLEEVVAEAMAKTEIDELELAGANANEKTDKEEWITLDDFHVVLNFDATGVNELKGFINICDPSLHKVEEKESLDD